jgi:hypothetical protein
MAGGSGRDSSAMAIGYLPYGQESLEVTCLREARPPFSPEQITKEFCETLKSYGISKVTGDKFAGSYPEEQFGRFGIRYEAAALPKSMLYVGLLPVINSCKISLLDNDRLIAQLCSLERRTRSSREQIDAPQGAPEDLANVVAGLVNISLHRYSHYDINSLADVDDTDPDGSRSWRQLRTALYLNSHGRIRL